MEERKFTFDDILLVPDYAENDSRENNDISNAQLFDYNLTVPILSAAMDTITEGSMMDAMWKNGALGIHHRYCDFSFLEIAARYHSGGIAISPSMDVGKIVKLGNNFPKTVFVTDVAHGDSKKVLNFCEELKKSGVKNIVSGNIVTKDAAYKYLKIGINHLRAGLGGGSVCTTRVVTGFGYPQASAIYDLYQEFGNDIVIISDGGAKNTGDIVKSFALGASFVITGYLLAGTEECPVQGIYRGMASGDALRTRKKEFFIEGDSIKVNDKGSVYNVINEIKDAIRHACHYGGVNNYRELINIEKIFITENSYLEGLTRK